MTTPAQSDTAATPRTDNEEWGLEHANGDKEMVVSADFARTIERELAASSAAVEEMRRELEKANARYIHECVTSQLEHDRAEQAEKSVTRLKQELGEADDVLREFNRE